MQETAAWLSLLDENVAREVARRNPFLRRRNITAVVAAYDVPKPCNLPASHFHRCNACAKPLALPDFNAVLFIFRPARPTTTIVLEYQAQAMQIRRPKLRI
jgi:hypothetical protein